MSEIRKNLGGVTAYAYARSKGYTGTEEEFAQLMANYATVGETATEAAEQASTKAGEASTSATNAATSASAASASATAAAGSASAAATSETNAAASASSASTSAESASESADDAAESAAAAQAVKDSIPADYTALSGEVTDLKNAINDDESVLFSLYRKEYKVVKTNTAISLAGKAVGDTLDLTPTTASNFGYLIIPCTADETFTLTANAGSGNHPWACLDVDNVILSIASGAIVANTTIITPTNTAKLVIRANCNSTVLVVRGRGIVNDLNGEEQILSLSVAAGYWTVNGSGGSASSYRRTMESIFFRAGTTFKINATAEGTATTGALITEWNDDGVFIQTLVASSDNAVQTVYTLDHDAYLRFSYINTYGFEGTITLPTSSEVMSAVSDTQRAVADDMYEWERVLNSVCCIGDSLTKGAYYVNGHNGSAIEQNYPYFFAKQTGLTVQNEGMSGSSPYSRWPYFSTFDFTPYNAFFIWWGTNGGLTDTLEADGVVDGQGNLIADYTTYADTNTGDYCKVIGKIISQVPHAKIFLGTIYTTGGTLDVTNEVIAKIASLYPNNVVGVVDNNDGTLYTLVSKKLTPPYVHIDNITHFSMVGNYYLAVHWIKAVRAIVAADPSKFENIMEDILS